MGVAFGKISVETPQHVVVHTTEQYQIWSYPQTFAATVYAKHLQLPHDATERDFTSKAFRTLASYIGVFGQPQNRQAQIGDNGESISMTAPVEVKTGENIAMTAPVDIKTGDDNNNNNATQDISNMQMSFFLPSKYTSLSQIPTPTNKAVEIVCVQNRYDAVVQYSGNLVMSSSKEKAAVMIQQLTDDGLEIVGEWSYCGYNPPFTLPWLKRNEVHVPVDGTRFHQVSTAE